MTVAAHRAWEGEVSPSLRLEFCPNGLRPPGQNRRAAVRLKFAAILSILRYRLFVAGEFGGTVASCDGGSRAYCGMEVRRRLQDHEHSTLYLTFRPLPVNSLIFTLAEQGGGQVTHQYAVVLV